MGKEEIENAGDVGYHNHGCGHCGHSERRFKGVTTFLICNVHHTMVACGDSCERLLFDGKSKWFRNDIPPDWDDSICYESCYPTISDAPRGEPLRPAGGASTKD